MASGLLTGAFTAGRAALLEPGDWRARHPDFTEPALSANLALARALRSDRARPVPGQPPSRALAVDLVPARAWRLP
jgi:hypothetical protein